MSGVSDADVVIAQAMLDALPAPVFVVDTEYRYLGFNALHAETIRELYGTEVRVGRSFLEVITQESDRERGGVGVGSALAGETSTETIWIGRGTMEARCLSVTRSPLRQDDRIVGATIVTHDVTERVLAEQKASDLAAIVAASGQAIIGVTFDGNVTSWNPGAERLTGWTADEAVGRPIEFVVPLGRRVHREGAAAAVRSGRHVDPFDGEVLRKDGETVAASVSLAPIFDETGTVVSVAVTAFDITERKQAEHALARELALSASLADLSRQLVSETLSLEDIGGLVLDGALALTGSAHGFTSYVEPETGDNVSANLTQMLPDGARTSGRVSSLRFSRDEDGNFPGLCAYCMNTGEAFFTNHPASHPASTGVPDGHVELCSFLSVPAVGADGLIGQVAIANAPGGFDDQDLDAVKRLTALYAVALTQHKGREALARETRLLKQAERVAGMGSWRMKTGSGRLEWSEGMRAVLGVSDGGHVGDAAQILSSIVYPEDRPGLRELIAASIADGIPRPHEFRIIRADGAVRWLRGDGVQEIDDDGRVVALRGYVQDITERRAAEEALRLSEEKFAAAFRTSPDAFLIIRVSDGVFVEVNDGFVTASGHTAEEVVGKRWQDVPLLADPSQAEDLLQRVLAEGVLMGVEARTIHKDGSATTTLISAGLIEIAGEKHVLCIVRDITERKETEEALEAANERLSKAARALRTLSASGRVSVRATSEEQLLKDVCDVAVDVGGYRMAWVGYVLHDEAQSFLTVASAGFEEGYLDQIKASWGDNPRGQGPGGRAVRDGLPVVVHDTETDAGWTPWRELSRTHGYRSVVAVPLADPEGECFGMLGVYAAEPEAFDDEEVRLFEDLAADISRGIESLQRKSRQAAAEDALRLSEEKFSTAFRTSPDAVVITRLSDGLYLDVNEGFTRLSGFTAAELDGKTSHEVDSWVHTVDRDRMTARIATDGMIEDFEAPMRRRDGTVATVLLSARVIVVADEPCILTVARDISARKRAEEAVRQSETKYRAVADFTYDWESWRAGDGSLIWMSPSCERVTGYARQEFMADPDLVLRLVREEDRERVRRHFAGAGECGPETLEYRIVSRDGETRWIEHVCRAVYDEAGCWLGRRASDRDVSERKRIERAQEDFLAMVSHELRTPLTAILGFASLLQVEGRLQDTEVVMRSLARIEERAQHMQELVDELLQVTQLSAGSFTITRASVDVEQMLSACVGSLDPHTQGRVRHAIGPHVGRLECDASKMTVAVTNLLSNAAKFSEEDAPIHLTAARIDGGVAISVSDRGVGIEPGQREMVFDRFWQADMSATRSYAGVGLGLFIVRQIVEAHGGTVQARSRSGEGSVFSMWIPDGPQEQRK
jgi:PAS domain S-box-containing protein